MCILLEAWLLLSFLSVCLWRYQAAAMELSGVWSYQQHTGNIESFCQSIMFCFKTNASLLCIQPFHGNLACFPIFQSCYDKNSLLVVTLNDASARFKSSSCNQHFSLNWKRFSYQLSHFQRWWCIDATCNEKKLNWKWFFYQRSKMVIYRQELAIKEP